MKHLKKNRVIIFTFFLVFLFCNCFADRTAAVGTAVSADGVSIAFQTAGKGDTGLVFVHGWCCDRSYWRKQVPYFIRNYRV
jgi:hypothetical protein